ncbi:nucleotide-binding alpha-beta plait domain-containing protein [Tanacetum coccineum]
MTNGFHNNKDGSEKLERREEDIKAPSHSGQDDGGEWVKVTRKYKGSKYGAQQNGRRSNADMQDGKRRLTDFNKVMRDKETFFFFTNFPDSWDNGALWKMFSRYGKVVDVYVAFKRTKRDTRFGFVRFITIGDILSFESKLKGIMSGTERIIINRVKFIKVGSNMRSSPPFNFVKSILLEEDAGLKARLECCWVGKAKNYQDANGDSYGRLTWFFIDGLPLVARNLTAIKTVMKDFGKIVEFGKVDFDSKLILPVKVLMLVDNLFHANHTLPLNGWDPCYNIIFNHNGLESDNDNDSPFEEEFVRPSVVVENDGDRVRGHPLRNMEDEESTPVHSPVNSTRVSHSSCIGTNKEINDGTENAHFPISQGGVKDSKVDHGTNDIQEDNELDDLLSSFKCLSQKATTNQSKGGRRKNSKLKKKKLVDGEVSCSSQASAGGSDRSTNDVDEESAMRAFGEKIEYSFKPTDQFQAIYRS